MKIKKASSSAAIILATTIMSICNPAILSVASRTGEPDAKKYKIELRTDKEITHPPKEYLENKRKEKRYTTKLTKAYQERVRYSSKNAYDVILFDNSKLTLPNLSEISHPFCRTIRSADLLINWQADYYTNLLSLGTIYKIKTNKNNIVEKQADIGKVLLNLPEGYKIDQNNVSWAVLSMRVETILKSETDPKNTNKTKIVREFFFDRGRICYIGIDIHLPAEINPKTTTVQFTFPLEKRDWLVMLKHRDNVYLPSRVPLFTIKPKTEEKTLQFYICLSPIPSKENTKISPEILKMSKLLERKDPISSEKSKLTRRIRENWPAIDVPDPWIKKAWLANIVAIESLTKTEEIYLQDPKDNNLVYLDINGTEQLYYLLDARWSLDTSYLVGSVLKILKNNTEANASIRNDLIALIKDYNLLLNSPIPELNITHSEDFRPNTKGNLFVNNDFDLPAVIDLKLNKLFWNLPCGLINRFITEIVGISVSNSAELVIEPSPTAKRYPYFAITNLPYKSHVLTIVWQDPAHYYKRYKNTPTGFTVYIDKKRVLNKESLDKVRISLQ